jgi:hypothetical protein
MRAEGRIADPRIDLHYFGSWILIRIRIRVKNSEALEAQNRAGMEGRARKQMEARRLKMKPCTVFRPVVED